MHCTLLIAYGATIENASNIFFCLLSAEKYRGEEVRAGCVMLPSFTASFWMFHFSLAAERLPRRQMCEVLGDGASVIII